MIKIRNTPVENAWGDGYVKEIILDNGEKYTIRNTPVENAWGDGYVKEITKRNLLDNNTQSNTYIICKLIGIVCILIGIFGIVKMFDMLYILIGCIGTIVFFSIGLSYELKVKIKNAVIYICTIILLIIGLLSIIPISIFFINNLI